MSRKPKIQKTMKTRLFISFAIFTVVLLSPVTGDLAGDRQALLDFLNNITHSRSLVWNTSSPMCATWQGIKCDPYGTRVTEVRLPGSRLIGSVPSDTLSRLSELRILSLRSNGLKGPFPSDLLRLKKLNGLYLKNNRFTGPLPSDYSTWQNLTVLELSNNRFNGTIPEGFANLTGLVSLNLANNMMSGQIPNLNLPSMRQLNLSNNNLSGTIPRSLLRFGSSAFSGNSLIYENAPPPAVSPSPSPSPGKKETRRQSISLTKPVILGIAISGCFIIFLLLAILMLICHSNRRRSREAAKEKAKTKVMKAKEIKSPSQKEGYKPRGENLGDEMEESSNRVVFFEGSNLVFNLEDLLGASAQFLGRGTFGMTYKAVLEDSKVVAVKRLKDVVVLKKEYEQQMEVVGKIRHDNVSPLRAYVCTKDEKLLVYDFQDAGSLFALLHGNKGGGEVPNPLDWQTRLRFMIGAAKGLEHIHTHHKLAHGNIKSSNVFMNSEGYGCISETGLATLTNPVRPVMASSARSLHYRAPEVTDTRKSTPESDVFSFGVLILEMLTGKSTMTRARESDMEEIHLLTWVNLVVKEQWTGEVFDMELLKTKEIEAKLIQVLELGLSCAVRAPGRRPKMTHVVETLEEIERT